MLVNDFGIVANSTDDARAALNKAIHFAKEQQSPVEIEFQQGTYHFYRNHSNQVPYYITNTTSETENSDVTKHIGI